MIQGGDPEGNGRGGPGYRFADEINADSLGLRKELVAALTGQGYHYLSNITSRRMAKGSLAMANAGPDSNGSQFFINEEENEGLNGRHTVFGQVVLGQSVVNAIANTPRGPDDKPNTPVVIKKISPVAN